MRLLIVDDSLLTRKMLESNLAQLGLEIVGLAVNGIEAIALVAEHSPDVVTLDITMPEMDGLTAMRKILQMKPDTKILIVSALNSKDKVVEALTDGACGYVIKPFTPEKLSEEITKIQRSMK